MRSKIWWFTTHFEVPLRCSIAFFSAFLSFLAAPMRTVFLEKHNASCFFQHKSAGSYDHITKKRTSRERFHKGHRTKLTIHLEKILASWFSKRCVCRLCSADTGVSFLRNKCSCKGHLKRSLQASMTKHRHIWKHSHVSSSTVYSRSPDAWFV